MSINEPILSPWEAYLDCLNAKQKQEILAWLASRPPKIQKLCRKFPPGSKMYIDSKIAYVVGYKEVRNSEPLLYFSYIDPDKNYEKSVKTKFSVRSDDKCSVVVRKEKQS